MPAACTGVLRGRSEAMLRHLSMSGMTSLDNGGLPVMSDQGAVFRALHAEPGAFIIPNPWDVGSARILAASGFRGAGDDQCRHGVRAGGA